MANGWLPAQSKPIQFQPPTRAQQIAAVGSLVGLSPIEQKAFAITDDFQVIHVPGPMDWLAWHREVPQTFADFTALQPAVPTAQAHTICIQPLGNFPGDRSPALDDLREFCAAYFGLETRVLPAIALRGSGGVRSRARDGGLVQYLSTDILALLRKGFAKDAFCVIGVTMEDLYPEESWNFVFGQASSEERVGIFSFKRYTPEWNRQRWTDESRLLLLQRSCAVLAHETGHMFGLDHCTFFECQMCGSNHLAESDARPLHFCPVCLRKLYSSARFDLAERYRKLLVFYEKHALGPEAKWVKRRIERLQSTP